LTDAQLYLAIGMPSVVALIGILVNVGYFVAMNARFTGMDGRFTGLDGRMTALETRLSTLAEQTATNKTLLDIVLKKLDELEAKIHL
jgi:hypothetical protein